MTDLHWRFKEFSELSVGELYQIVSLREAVFVVEQRCPFLDADGADPSCRHLLGLNGENDLIAYARIVPPGVKFPEPSIGRIVTASAARKTGVGKLLLREAIARTQKCFPAKPIRISAQQYLKRFYESFGFRSVRGPYDEDGIPHLEMVLDAPQMAS